MDAETQMLTAKEGEGLMWGLVQIFDYLGETPTDSQDPLFVLAAKGWKRAAIGEACEGLMEMQYANALPDKPTPLEADILRCCVENSSWITTYRTCDPTKNSKPHIDEALAALRSLSAKLERIGIEINHIPYD